MALSKVDVGGALSVDARGMNYKDRWLLGRTIELIRRGDDALSAARQAHREWRQIPEGLRLPGQESA